MPRFTEEEYIEILKARARLEEWRAKFQPYVSYSDEAQQDKQEGHDSPPQVVVEHIVRYSNLSKAEFALLQEHDRALKYLMGKQTEREARTKPKGEY